MNRSFDHPDSDLVIFEVDASNAKRQKITDPGRLAEVRKLVGDLEKYGYIKPRAEGPTPADAPPDADATSPPTPS